MREDYTDCPEEGNLVVRFSYPVESRNGFTDIATSVDLLLFDASDHLIRVERIENIETEEMTLSIDPGLYRIIAWINRGANSTFSETEEGNLLQEGRLLNTAHFPGDPFYYGSQVETEVKAGEEKTCEIHLVRSHRTLHLYLEGLTRDEENLPITEIENTPIGYDLLMELQEDSRITYRSRSQRETRDEKELLYSSFHLPLFNETDPVTVTLRQGTDESEITRFPLDDYLKNYPPEDEHEIHIHVRFFEGNIEIKIPGWETAGEVTPEF